MNMGILSTSRSLLHRSDFINDNLKNIDGVTLKVLPLWYRTTFPPAPYNCIKKKTPQYAALHSPSLAFNVEQYFTSIKNKEVSLIVVRLWTHLIVSLCDCPKQEESFCNRHCTINNIANCRVIKPHFTIIIIIDIIISLSISSSHSHLLTLHCIMQIAILQLSSSQFQKPI